MSILANITVIKCDRCNKVVVLTSPEERENYKATWFTDVFFDFCPSCRLMPPAPSKMDISKVISEAELEKVF